MVETALVPASDSPAAIMERVIITGDLAALTPAERVVYYMRVCESLGLNPLTKPFDYIVLDGKMTLYPNKDCAAQLRRIQHISITNLIKELIGEVYTVTIFGREGDREDVATGAVNIKGLGGTFLANAYMKAETKAKRRLSLSLAGLGFADESEIEDVPQPPVEEGQKPLTLAEKVAERREAITVADADALPTADPEPIVVEGTAVETPAAAPTVCGDQAPADYTPDATCGLATGHTGNHKASTKETWAPGRKP